MQATSYVPAYFRLEGHDLRAVFQWWHKQERSCAPGLDALRFQMRCGGNFQDGHLVNYSLSFSYRYAQFSRYSARISLYRYRKEKSVRVATQNLGSRIQPVYGRRGEQSELRLQYYVVLKAELALLAPPSIHWLDSRAYSELNLLQSKLPGI